MKRGLMGGVREEVVTSGAEREHRRDPVDRARQINRKMGQGRWRARLENKATAAACGMLGARRQGVL